MLNKNKISCCHQFGIQTYLGLEKKQRAEPLTLTPTCCETFLLPAKPIFVYLSESYTGTHWKR